MAAIPYPDKDDPAPEAAVLFEHCEKMMGRVANAVRMSTHSPKVAQPLLGFLIAILRHEITGVLDMPTKALVILKTSMLNGCAYCVGHNTALGKSLGFDDEAIAAIEGDYGNSDRFTDFSQPFSSQCHVLSRLEQVFFFLGVFIGQQ